LLVAALPSKDGGQRYFVTDRVEHHARALARRPDPDAHPAEARLWDALHARFRGELPEVAGPR
jgi:hypothetical protein